MTRTACAVQSVPAYQATQICVEFGVNAGDPFGVFDDLVMDDIYELSQARAPQRLGLMARPDGSFQVHRDTALGQPGATLHLDCAVTLMPDQGDSLEALVLVEVDGEGMIAEVYLVPQAPLAAQCGYRLVSARRDSARQVMAQMACVSFTRGTHITLGTGAQVQIEDLNPGDRVLTRNNGVQEVRWIGQTTTRAVGDMAPILIRAGALNNAHDLLVSPEHRLMVYQRSDEIGVGSAEVLVRARDLVNGDTVLVQDGGFVDYFQILFDRHYIIYAEGIAAESLLLDPMTQPAIPPELRPHLAQGQIHGARSDHGVEVSRTLIDRPDLVDLLRRASLR
ncbi:Hint domain-containing protein [Phaeobacter sp. HF9A]|uniref:Hint domain-containing protein n=1 Tax=Phaeobacter sp. HF9A TaxID=2721561 RepID=UPI001430C206|nr:Hint domain-containing protein [Phaeobacter sp. HF9A]